jgi:hypothetical protein
MTANVAMILASATRPTVLQQTQPLVR